MSENKVVPLNKITSAAIEYFGFRSGVWFAVVKKDSTVSAAVVYSYAQFASETLYNSAIASPGTIMFDLVPDEYLLELDLESLFLSTSTSGGGGGDATAANQVAEQVLIGSLTETAPASDTASSGLNGRLQRIAQRLTSLIALLPVSIGQKTKAASLSVTLASDQDAINLGNIAAISTANSSIATLGIGGVFTGTSEDISQYTEVRVYVFADQASAVNGLSVQQSSNGTNWDSTDVYTIAASTGFAFSFGRAAQFYRIVYTNGGVAQGTFRLQTIFSKTASKSSSIRPGDARTNEIDTEEVSTYGMVYNGTTWDRARGTSTEGQYVTQVDKTTTGNITTQNLNATGAGTAGSFVGFTNLQGAGGALVQVTGTYTGVLTPQISLDGTNWISDTYLSYSILNINTGGQSSTIASATQGIFEIKCTGAKYFRIVALAPVTGTAVVTINCVSQTGSINVVSALPGGSNSIGNIGTLGAITPGTAATNLGKAEDGAHTTGDTLVGMAAVRQDLLLTPTSATNDYSYVSANRHGNLLIAGFRTSGKSYKASANISPVATPTDIAAIFGNATNTVQLVRIRITGIQTVTGTPEIIIAKRTTANTGSTPVNFSVARMETADGANSSTPVVYTVANPTTGTLEGNMDRRYVVIPVATAGLNNECVFEFNDDFGKAGILSGVAQGVCINLNGVTLTGGTLNVTFEWIEY